MADLQGIALIITTATTSIGTFWGIYQSVQANRREELARVKLEVREGQRIIGGEPLYSREALYTSVRVINRSKRKIKISSAGLSLLNIDGGMVFADSIRQTHIIEPYEAVDIHAKETPEDAKPKVAYYYVSLTTGETFRLYVTPRLWVWCRGILHKIRMWKKKPLLD
jgi:hypothetical protein